MQEKLMNPMLNHSDPRNKLILQESTVGFSLLNASLVKMPVFKEKQWVLITANFRANFFDIMNPYYSGDTFLPVISVVIYNFKTLFTATHGNTSSFNIGNFESRFLPAPKVNLRYDSGLFLLHYVSKYKGVALEGFSIDDIQALHHKFLFEIITCMDNEIQLPLVTSFPQSHVSSQFTVLQGQKRDLTSLQPVLWKPSSIFLSFLSFSTGFPHIQMKLTIPINFCSTYEVSLGSHCCEYANFKGKCTATSN